MRVFTCEEFGLTFRCMYQWRKHSRKDRNKTGSAVNAVLADAATDRFKGTQSTATEEAEMSTAARDRAMG